jgi:hypothetical protein
MANIPSVGVFLPGTYLNRCNSLYRTGAGDAYGNIYPTGLELGKMIEIGDLTAAALTSPASAYTLFGGSYQWVQVDSGATAAYVQPGRIAFIKLDPGGTAGLEPELGFAQMTVTSQDQADAITLIAGVFINATPPGSYDFIFVGDGRVNAAFASSLTAGQAIGDVCGVKSGNNGLFDDTSGVGTAATNALTVGIACTAPVVNGTSAIWVTNNYARIPQV